MLRHRYIEGTIALLLALGGCASLEQHDWYNKAHEVSIKTVDIASDRAGKAFTRMQQYLAKKDLLKTFSDAGEHSESVVLNVLHKAGVSASKGGAATPARPASPPAGAAAPPKLPSTLPNQYAGALRWPVDAGVVSSEFGARRGKVHKGIDIAADVGEPVYAIAPGEVIYAGNGLRGYGNVIILRHDQHRTSLYAHNSALKVKQGDTVAAGALVALLGNTGHSTGPHVHFEIRDGDAPVNPRTVLPQTKLADVIGNPGSEPALMARAGR
jgi:murein DD-endopeptidase MepM/ murein hydrolase activator NlpD